MPTPDPIALPELPEPSLIQDEREFVYAYDADDMRAYGQACVDAAHPIPADMVLVPRGELNRVIHELRTYAPAADTYKGAHIHGVWAKELEQLSATPPLNELLGHPEQLASLEQRARRLGQLAEPPYLIQPSGCRYTPQEVGRMLANRVVQPHYAEWLVHKAITSALANQQGMGVPDVSDAEISAWLDRHDLSHAIRGTDARAAFEDAQSFVLTMQPTQPAGDVGREG